MPARSVLAGGDTFKPAGAKRGPVDGGEHVAIADGQVRVVCQGLAVGRDQRALHDVSAAAVGIAGSAQGQPAGTGPRQRAVAGEPTAEVVDWPSPPTIRATPSPPVSSRSRRLPPKARRDRTSRFSD